MNPQTTVLSFVFCAFDAPCAPFLSKTVAWRVRTAAAALYLSLAFTASAVPHYVDANGTNAQAPYLEWDTAATNIQDAVDVALAGEDVVVTNGVYAAGGKVIGNLTNRVVLDKALRVMSVNGPGATFIQGAYDPTSTNGPGAVRCAWLTNNATLSGFTLCGGATHKLAVPFDQSMVGGGVWASSTTATLDQCLVISNFASYKAGGAYQATMNNCQIIGNHAVGWGAGTGGAGSGGGAASCNLRNCMITGNFAHSSMPGGGTDQCNLTNCALTGNWGYIEGGAANGGSLVNCTVSGNSSSVSGIGSLGGAVYGAALTNCILWGNLVGGGRPYTNYNDCTLAYCCSAPLAPGPGNLSLDPQLLADGIHLSESSPCRGAGLTNVISGTDIDGQAWTNPPPIGCDEWQPVVLIALQPTAQAYSAVDRIAVGDVVATGHGPFGYFWYKDGLPLESGAKYGLAHQSTLIVSNFCPADVGGYQTVVSNAFGMVTSRVAQVVVHCADAAGTNAQPPYATWATASTDIQSAINLASAGDFVLVTNGLYATGGKALESDLTNRVAVDKALTVMSVNGPGVTTIQGAWDPATTNGPSAIRCASLVEGAALNGFTLRGGATRTTFVADNAYGGGVYSPPAAHTLVLNCLVCSNAAGMGGGAANGWLRNCLIVGNLTVGIGEGGGAIGANLASSTIVGNWALNSGAGTMNCNATNCIICFNSTLIPGPMDDVFSGFQASCCVFSRNLGGNNLFADPQLMDSFHVGSTSPCQGAGNFLYASGTDLDGDSWLNPPSIGCDEVVDSVFFGPLAVGIQPPQTAALVNHPQILTGVVTGRAARLEWSFGDATTPTNSSFITSHTWSNTGDYTVSFTAYNGDNPAGVSTTQVIHVSLPTQPLLQVPMLLTNGIQLTFPGQFRVTYVTDVATNLAPPIVWQPLNTNIGLGSAVQVTDPVSTNAARYYRIRAR